MRRGGAPLPRGYHRGAMAGGWRIEAYGRSVRGAELRVHLPARAPPPARRRAARRGARDRPARARHPRSRPGSRLVLRDRALREPRRRGDGHAPERARRRPQPQLPGHQLARGHDAELSGRDRPRASACPANRTQVSSTGSAPLSEPESAALAALIERLEPALVLDLHAPLELVLTTPLVPARGRARARRRRRARAHRRPRIARPRRAARLARRRRRALHHLRGRARRTAGALPRGTCRG